MIQELELQKEDYEEMLIHYLMTLLINIHRVILSKPKKRNLLNMDEMDKAAQYFRSNITNLSASKIMRTLII